MLALLLLVAASVVATEHEQCSADGHSSPCETQGPASGDVKICYTDPTNKYSIPLINDKVFMDSIRKLNQERLPERVVHAKGTGAFGYFQVTHDISHICKADFLKEVGKKTPVAVRFSTGGGERGSSDFARDTRGLSVKFYTNEGNLDLIGFHTEMYFYKDPLRFSSVVHGIKRKPDSNLHDMDTYWDSITLLPETLNFFLRLLSDQGIPASYRHMSGFPIHTYQVVNSQGVNSWVRFQFKPCAGVKTVTAQEAMELGAADPDYTIRDMYEAINKGEFPSWNVSVQILTKDDMYKNGPRYIDVTRLIPNHPWHEIGKLVLNKNAEHFQNDIEKLALCPCNLVPGILGAPDKLFESRALIYRDTQLYRLGKNRNKIPVNCPLNTISTYNRDGMPPVGDNEGDAVNYYPNSFGGPQPYDKERYINRTCGGSGLIKIRENPAVDNFDQILDFYTGLSDEEKTSLIDNMATSLGPVQPFIKERTVNILKSIHLDFGNRLAQALDITLS